MATTFHYGSTPTPLSTAALGHGSAARRRNHAVYRHMALWTLQGWLAMFFIAAGYAKIAEPMHHLVTLLTWPSLVSREFVCGLGITELLLALGVLAPLVSWRLGRPILMVAASGLFMLEAIMLGIHALEADLGLSIVNVCLLAITIPVLVGRREG